MDDGSAVREAGREPGPPIAAVVGSVRSRTSTPTAAPGRAGRNRRIHRRVENHAVGDAPSSSLRPALERLAVGPRVERRRVRGSNASDCTTEPGFRCRSAPVCHRRGKGRLRRRRRRPEDPGRPAPGQRRGHPPNGPIARRPSTRRRRRRRPPAARPARFRTAPPRSARRSGRRPGASTRRSPETDCPPASLSTRFRVTTGLPIQLRMRISGST
jgi:hypothetical protein